MLDLQARAYNRRGARSALALMPVEMVVYRPIMAWARLKGTWRFMRGDRAWHKFERNVKARPREVIVLCRSKEESWLLLVTAVAGLALAALAVRALGPSDLRRRSRPPPRSGSPLVRLARPRTRRRPGDIGGRGRRDLAAARAPVGDPRRPLLVVRTVVRLGEPAALRPPRVRPLGAPHPGAAFPVLAARAPPRARGWHASSRGGGELEGELTLRRTRRRAVCTLVIAARRVPGANTSQRHVLTVHDVSPAGARAPAGRRSATRPPDRAPRPHGVRACAGRSRPAVDRVSASRSPSCSES